jgi:predicted hydrocarbon binding protein
MEKMEKKSSMELVTVDNALRVDRVELGTNVPVALFRLVRLVAFEEILGRGAAGPAYIAGKRLGKALGLPDVSAFLKLCEDLNIGKIRVPKQDDRSLYVDVYECVTCAGLTPVGRKLCSFEGGLIAGVMESIVKKPVTATEVTCIGGLGHKTCGFDVQIGEALSG